VIFQGKVKVIKNIKVIKSYYKITISCPSMVKDANPGQFIEIKVTDNYEPFLRRPFSIHQVTRSPGHQVTSNIEILYEVVGKGTELLSRIGRGEYLDVIGPLGNGFDYRLPITDYRLPILVAGGMGVAPLVFLAQKLQIHNTQYTIHNTLVLIGAKTKAQLLCEKEFKDLGFSVKIATDDGSRGLKGKVTDLLKEALRLTINQKRLTIFSCGPRPMLQEIAALSKRYNIPAWISLEEHMACGMGACFGCAVKTRYSIPNTQYEYKRVCKEGPVFDAKEIIW